MRREPIASLADMGLFDGVVSGHAVLLLAAREGGAFEEGHGDHSVLKYRASARVDLSPQAGPPERLRVVQRPRAPTHFESPRYPFAGHGGGELALQNNRYVEGSRSRRG